MNDRVLLDVDLLLELEQRWRSQRAPLLTRLRPGLADAEIDRLSARVDLRLPDEARVWWGWHDGVPVEHFGVARELGPQLPYLPLAEALELYEHRRSLARTAGPLGDQTELGDPDYWWDPSWLPITESGNGTVVTCDCSVGPGDPTPVRAIFWGDMSEARTPATRSFGQLVEWWIDALDAGAWHYDEAIGRWHYSYERVPTGRQRTGAL